MYKPNKLYIVKSEPTGAELDKFKLPVIFRIVDEDKGTSYDVTYDENGHRTVLKDTNSEVILNTVNNKLPDEKKNIDVTLDDAAKVGSTISRSVTITQNGGKLVLWGTNNAGINYYDPSGDYSSLSVAKVSSSQGFDSTIGDYRNPELPIHAMLGYKEGIEFWFKGDPGVSTINRLLVIPEKVTGGRRVTANLQAKSGTLALLEDINESLNISKEYTDSKQEFVKNNKGWSLKPYLNNTTTGLNAINLGYESSSITGEKSIILGGGSTTISGERSLSLNGEGNTISGIQSTVIGNYNNIKSGYYNVVIGNSSTVSGNNNFVTSNGFAVTVSGDENTIIGTSRALVESNNNVVIGNNSVVIPPGKNRNVFILAQNTKVGAYNSSFNFISGDENSTQYDYSIIIGRYNTPANEKEVILGEGATNTKFSQYDNLFKIGAGIMNANKTDILTRRDAFIIDRAGLAYLPMSTKELIETSNIESTIITKDYLESKQEFIKNNKGWSLKAYKNNTTSGLNAINLGYDSSTITGENSIILGGRGVTVFGVSSVSIGGDSNNISSSSSLAIGSNNNISGGSNNYVIGYGSRVTGQGNFIHTNDEHVTVTGNKNTLFGADRATIKNGNNNVIIGGSGITTEEASSENVIIGGTSSKTGLGNYNVIIGRNNESFFKESKIIGTHNVISNDKEIILGIAATNSKYSLNDTILKVGIGILNPINESVLERKDGLIIDSSGLGYLPTSTKELIETSDKGTSIVTKDYLNLKLSNINRSGLDDVLNVSNTATNSIHLKGVKAVSEMWDDYPTPWYDDSFTSTDALGTKAVSIGTIGWVSDVPNTSGRISVYTPSSKQNPGDNYSNTVATLIGSGLYFGKRDLDTDQNGDFAEYTFGHIRLGKFSADSTGIGADGLFLSKYGITQTHGLDYNETVISTGYLRMPLVDKIGLNIKKEFGKKPEGGTYTGYSALYLAEPVNNSSFIQQLPEKSGTVALLEDLTPSKLIEILTAATPEEITQIKTILGL